MINEYIASKEKELADLIKKEKELTAIYDIPIHRKGVKNPEEITVTGHYKYLKDGMPYWWGIHIRMPHHLRTEANTEGHKRFVNTVKNILNNSTEASKTILNRIDGEFINGIIPEVVINDRRCDLLVELRSGRKIAIECQLSDLSSNELYDRTLNYITNGYDVIWVRKSGINYQRIYYWLKDDCNKKPEERLRKVSEGALAYSYACAEGNYYADISKGDYNLIYIKLFKRR